MNSSFSLEEVTKSDIELHKKAIEVMANAYVPHSKFKVGAAIQLEDGTEFYGCNIENASFGATICAERSAISALISKCGVSSFAKIAVAVEGGRGEPCGICRQTLCEFAPDAKILFQSEGELIATKVRNLLPFAFDEQAL